MALPASRARSAAASSTRACVVPETIPPRRRRRPVYRVLTPAATGSPAVFALGRSWRPGPSPRASGIAERRQPRDHRDELVRRDLSVRPARRRTFASSGGPASPECQILIAHDRAEAFLDRAGPASILSIRPPSVMLSVKAFDGAPRLLRFEGAGLASRSILRARRATLDLLRRLDELTIACRWAAAHHQGLPPAPRRCPGMLSGVRSRSAADFATSIPTAAIARSCRSASAFDLRHRRSVGGRRARARDAVRLRPATTLCWWPRTIATCSATAADLAIRHGVRTCWVAADAGSGSADAPSGLPPRP